MDYGKSYENWYKVQRTPGRYTENIELFVGLNEEEWLKLEGISTYQEEKTLSNEFADIKFGIKKELPSNFDTKITSPPGGRGADWIGIAIQIFSIAEEAADDIGFAITAATAIKKAVDWVKKKRDSKPILSVGAIKYICLNELINSKKADLESLEFLGAQDVANNWGENISYDTLDVYMLTFIDSKNIFYFFTDAFGKIIDHGIFKIPKEMKIRRGLE